MISHARTGGGFSKIDDVHVSGCLRRDTAIINFELAWRTSLKLRIERLGKVSLESHVLNFQFHQFKKSLPRG
jgi:hypothetical protein